MGERVTHGNERYRHNHARMVLLEIHKRKTYFSFLLHLLSVKLKENTSLGLIHSQVEWSFPQTQLFVCVVSGLTNYYPDPSSHQQAGTDQASDP